MKKLSVVIVSFNSEDFINRCLSSLLKYLPANSEVIVLDNASKDETLNILSEFKSKIKIIKSDKNLGFAKGNNLAVQDTNGEYLFFLNPDTEIKKDFFQSMLAFLESNSQIGIVGPKLIMPNGEIQPSVKNLPTLLGAINEFILGVKNAYSQYVPIGDELQEVETVYGAAMLIKREIFLKAGGFDEKFFLYYEDIDLCRRIKNMGKKIIYYPKAEVLHLVGATKSSQNRYKLNFESAKKYHGFITAFLLQCIFQIPRLRRRLMLG